MKQWIYRYWFAANRREGCGHRHANAATAAKCATRVSRRGVTFHVYEVTTRRVYNVRQP